MLNKRVPVVLSLIILAAVISAVSCGSSEAPVQAVKNVRVERQVEGGIFQLIWDSPRFATARYEIEWRYGDVPHWATLSVDDLRIVESERITTEAIDTTGDTLTNGFEAEYCYRVRAEAENGEVSDWSAEQCALHSNWFWNEGWAETSQPPGELSDIAVERDGESVNFSWSIEPTDWTSAVEVWKRSIDAADYETLASLPPTPESSTFMDESGAGSESCYRMAVVNEPGQARLYQDICPT